MKDLSITIVQTDLVWENKEKNLDALSARISSIKESTDLIVLPEMFSTGFSMRPELFAEKMEGATVTWMKKIAKEKNAVLAGSFICEDNGKHFNRLAWVRPDGTVSTYDKRHLFSMGDEDNHYGKGIKRLIVDLNGWKICPLICYDLRFPVWARNKSGVGSKESGDGHTTNTSAFDYDVLIYVANWPERRSHPWKSLLVARAIENQAYCVGVNRIGNDNNDIFHSGDSAALSFKGEAMSNIEPGKDVTETVVLNYKELEAFRKQFPVLNDADDFEIK